MTQLEPIYLEICGSHGFTYLGQVQHNANVSIVHNTKEATVNRALDGSTYPS